MLHYTTSPLVKRYKLLRTFTSQLFSKSASFYFFSHYINILRFSNNSPHIYATTSFDHSCKLWDLRINSRQNGVRVKNLFLTEWLQEKLYLSINLNVPSKIKIQGLYSTLTFRTKCFNELIQSIIFLRVRLIEFIHSKILFFYLFTPRFYLLRFTIRPL